MNSTIDLSGQTINGLVLLKPRILNDKITFKSGGVLYIDTTFNENEHTNKICDVIKVPDSCSYRDHNGDIQPWPVEVIEGDVAYCYYLPIQNSLKRKFDGKSFIHNGELYILINYYLGIFMVIRDGVPIPVNDYLIVEHCFEEYSEIEEKVTKSGIILPSQIKKEAEGNTRYGIVRYAGKNLSPPEYFRDEDLHVGTKIRFRRGADIPLEYKDHQTFEKGKVLFRVRRRDVDMVFND